MFRPRGRQLPPVVHPTKCVVKHHCCEYIVPEVHPTHVQNVTHHNYKHVHSFPVTQSNVNEVSHQHFNAPSPAPTAVSPFGPGQGPMGPTAVSPYGPGQGPGAVAGAMHGKHCGCGPKRRRPFF